MLGVAEDGGRAVIPPAGIDSADFSSAQLWIRRNCNRLDPPFQPIIWPGIFKGRNILVVWVPASDIRPHRAPDGPRGGLKYWIRLGSETVDVERRGGALRTLVEQTARIPWEDRRSLRGGIEDLRRARVCEYLLDIGRTGPNKCTAGCALPVRPTIAKCLAMPPSCSSPNRPTNGLLPLGSRSRTFPTVEQGMSLTSGRSEEESRDRSGIACATSGDSSRLAQSSSTTLRRRVDGLAIRMTGLPRVFSAMRANRFPDRRFDFDDDRSSFQFTLPAHSKYPTGSAPGNSGEQ